MERRQFLRQTGTAAIGVTMVGGFDRATAAVHSPPMISTYGHYDYQQPPGPDQGYYLTLTDGHTETDYDTVGDIPNLDTECADVVVYVHGWDIDDEQAVTVAGDVHSALQDDGYSDSFVGYSWDAFPWSRNRSYEIADRNGTKLAQFLIDVKTACPDQAIHLVVHGLGARVGMSTLEAIDAREEWTSEMTIGSVQMMGAAVDDTAPASSPIDQIIPSQTELVKNHHSEDDTVLSDMARNIESIETPLGKAGVPSNQIPPENYTDINVTTTVGADHSAYITTVSDGIVADIGNEEKVEYSWPLYAQGDESEAVYTIQYLLGHHGYELDDHDGIYGPETQGAIESFQNDQGLLVDGIVGPNTWSELIVNVLGPDQAPWWATFAAQHNLKHGHGYDIAVDGDYGPETRTAIEDFQRVATITVDGLVGPETWQALVDRL